MHKRDAEIFQHPFPSLFLHLIHALFHFDLRCSVHVLFMKVFVKDHHFLWRFSEFLPVFLDQFLHLIMQSSKPYDISVCGSYALFNGVQEAGSSNLLTQTLRNPLKSKGSGFFIPSLTFTKKTKKAEKNDIIIVKIWSKPTIP